MGTARQAGYEDSVSLRYDDIAQDGRLLLGALSPMLGQTVWTKLTNRPEVADLAAQGIVPILTRAVFEGTPGPFAQQVPMQTQAGYELAHAVDEHGNVTRLFLNMWLEARAPSGGTWSPPPPDAPAILAGRLFAEHVFTKPFAPAGERKVLSLPGIGVPRTCYESPPAMDAFEASGDEYRSEVVFSLMHTDSNQHVNSLVYPRLVEEAAANALGARGLSRFCEVRYRKPMFAGDRARIVLRAAESEGKLSVAGGFFVAGEAAPRTTCRIVLE